MNTLYWLNVRGGIPGRTIGAPGEITELFVGVLLDAQGKILRAITDVVTREQMGALDTALVSGKLAYPKPGCIVDSSFLLVGASNAPQAASGAR